MYLFLWHLITIFGSSIFSDIPADIVIPFETYQIETFCYFNVSKGSTINECFPPPIKNWSIHIFLKIRNTKSLCWKTKYSMPLTNTQKSI